MRFITSTSVFGIGLDAYLIIIILGIPVFFLWRRVFRSTAPKRKRLVITWLVTIFSVPLVYVAIIVILFLVNVYYPDRSFNKTDWDNNKDERYEYANNIISSKMLIGKTKAEVKKLFGDEGNKQNNDDWFYSLGFTPGSIDPDSIEIEFKNGKVESVMRHEHH
jgi:hypothetical protein